MVPCKIGVIIPLALRNRLFRREDIQRLEAQGQVVWTDSPEAQLSVPDAIALLQGCRIGIGSWGTPHVGNADLVNALPQLELWIHAAGSVKPLFGPHLQNRHIVVASCAPAIAENVAETTVGCLIIGLKRLVENAMANRSATSPKPANSLPLAACTVGVIGASQVGRRTMKYLAPFRPRLLIYDPYLSGEDAQALGAERITDLNTLCRLSDAITVHTPATPATSKMLGPAQFKVMKDDCVIVNTSRGTCLDQDALIAALNQGRFTAFLDVTDPEPAPADSPLRRLPNVYLTSHIAGGADNKIGRQAVDDVEAFLEHRPLAMAVTSDMLDRLA